MIDDALEAEFALRRRHPEREMVYDAHQRRSAIVRSNGACLLNQRYAAGPRCLLDIFPAGDRAPILFFIHGGYWRALDKSYVSFIAEPYRNAGITVVMPGYDLVPAVRVGGIADQMRLALDWTVRHLEPECIVVSGHSAGGQLAAMLALDQATRGEGPIIGLATVSGAFDLRPLLHTSINIDLGLSEDEAANPVRCFASGHSGKAPPWYLCSAWSVATKHKGSSDGRPTLSQSGAHAGRGPNCTRSPAEPILRSSTRLRHRTGSCCRGCAGCALRNKANLPSTGENQRKVTLVTHVPFSQRRLARG